ncbi:MAG: hypothetical protein ABIQ43_05850 [Sphingomonas sp.]
MTRAMAAAAVAMMFACVLVVTSGRTDAPTAFGFLLLHLFFAMMFTASAALSCTAGRDPA